MFYNRERRSLFDKLILIYHEEALSLIHIWVIELEKNLITPLVQIREEKELTQAQLADICEVSQPVIARLETAVHSPQLNSLLKILVPLGYTLEIVPLKKNFSN